MTRQQKITSCIVTETSSGHTVKSPSGSTYYVRKRARLDALGGMFFERECSCPAHGQCVHLEAVDRYVFGNGDPADEIMERVAS